MYEELKIFWVQNFTHIRVYEKGEKATFRYRFFVFSTKVYILKCIFLYYSYHMSQTELHEKSAGGIVYRKKWSYIEILMLAWKNARDDLEYVLPKGHIENDETAMETALREISEETGLAESDLKVIKFMNTVNYSFTATYLEWSPIIHKEVSLFLVKYTGKTEPRPRKEERFVGYKWFTPESLKETWIKPDVTWFIEKNIHFM